MMNWLRRLFNRPPVPDPRVGQRWRSENNGDVLVVHSVKALATGTVMVAAYVEEPGRDPRIPTPIPDHYACGLTNWRRNIRAEGRILIGSNVVPKP